MADDLAFDPYAAPQSARSMWGLDEQGNQIAQAPAQPPVVTPAPAPAPAAPAAPAPPAPTGAPALKTQAPPPPEPSQQSLWGDPDQLELNEARREADRAYFDPNNVLSRSHNFAPVHSQTKPEDHPQYADYNRLVKEVWPTLTPAQQKMYAPARDAMRKKINDDLKAQNAEFRKRHEEEMKAADAKWEDPEQREKTAMVIGAHVDAKLAEITAWSKHKDPARSAPADLALNTSPLATMKREKPDGTFDHQPLRDATTAIAMLNKLSNEQATMLALTIGSPVGFDDKTGKPLPGYNGRTGLGAANFKVIGSDIRKNAVIEFENGTRVVIPPTLLEQFAEARRNGYTAQKTWEAKRKADREPGLIGRHVIKPVTDWLSPPRPGGAPPP